MKNYSRLSSKILLPTILAVALGSLGLVSTAGAADKANKKIGDITCEEFLAFDTANQNRIVYWIHGYEYGKGETAETTIGMDKFDQPIEEIINDCKATPKKAVHKTLSERIISKPD
jgi:hypothetical protein